MKSPSATTNSRTQFLHQLLEVMLRDGATLLFKQLLQTSPVRRTTSATGHFRHSLLEQGPSDLHQLGQSFPSVFSSLIVRGLEALLPATGCFFVWRRKQQSPL